MRVPSLFSEGLPCLGPDVTKLEHEYIHGDRFWIGYGEDDGSINLMILQSNQFVTNLMHCYLMRNKLETSAGFLMHSASCFLAYLCGRRSEILRGMSGVEGEKWKASDSRM